MDLDENYTLEFYAENNTGVRGFSAYLSNIDLMMNHPPERTREIVELSISANQVLKLSMDSLFNDEDLNFGDSLVYAIVDSDNPELLEFTNWELGSQLSFAPVSGNSGSYNFWLKTTDLASESDSVQVILTVITTTGIEDLASDKRFLVYPNPAKDYVKIKTDGYNGYGYKLHLISSTGVLLSSIHINSNEYILDLKQFSTGIYFVVLKDDEFTLRKKLVHH